MSDSSSQANRKSISLSKAESAYDPDTRFLVLPADLAQDFKVCTAVVDALDGHGAWLAKENDQQSWPEDEEVFLVEFHSHDVLTHRTRILKRRKDRIWVDKPSLTEKERSQLAPFTGRHDYRVEVDLAAQLRLRQDDGVDTQPTAGRLRDLSRGGMSILTSKGQPFSTGQRVNVQLISWEYPVNIEAEVARASDEGTKQRLALKFPRDMTVSQREMLSAFILQVQRRDALSRSLPINED